MQYFYEIRRILRRLSVRHDSIQIMCQKMISKNFVSKYDTNEKR